MVGTCAFMHMPAEQSAAAARLRQAESELVPDQLKAFKDAPACPASDASQHDLPPDSALDKHWGLRYAQLGCKVEETWATMSSLNAKLADLESALGHSMGTIACCKNHVEDLADKKR